MSKRYEVTSFDYWSKGYANEEELMKEIAILPKIEWETFITQFPVTDSDTFKAFATKEEARGYANNITKCDIEYERNSRANYSLRSTIVEIYEVETDDEDDASVIIDTILPEMPDYEVYEVEEYIDRQPYDSEEEAKAAYDALTEDELRAIDVYTLLSPDTSLLFTYAQKEAEDQAEIDADTYLDEDCIVVTETHVSVHRHGETEFLYALRKLPNGEVIRV